MRRNKVRRQDNRRMARLGICRGRREVSKAIPAPVKSSGIAIGERDRQMPDLEEVDD